MNEKRLEGEKPKGPRPKRPGYHPVKEAVSRENRNVKEIIRALNILGVDEVVLERVLWAFDDDPDLELQPSVTVKVAYSKLWPYGIRLFVEGEFSALQKIEGATYR